jgi:acyl carrier protein
MLEPAKLVREILSAPTTLPPSVSETGFGTDSLDRVELAMAVEEEQGSMIDHDIDNLMKDFSKTEHVFSFLLGSVASLSTWDPATIWLRSIRSIVNERVRRRGGCRCG